MSYQKKAFFLQLLSNKRLMTAILASLFLIIFFQLGSNITAPGLKVNQNAQENFFIGLLNLLGGGGLTQVSLFAVGISPYITAQIILQMLSTDLVKPLAKLAKSGEKGRKKIEVYTRLLTLPFAIAQAYAVLALTTNPVSGIASFTNPAWTSLNLVPTNVQFALVLLFVAGTYIAIFISDVITKQGVGNGLTLLIMSGIIAGLPGNFIQAYTFITGQIFRSNHLFIGISGFIVYLFFYFFVFLGAIYVNAAVRKIPVQQISSGVIQKVEGLPYLPIKLNPSGVVPVIFGSTIISIPTTIAQLIDPNNPVAVFIRNNLSLNTWLGIFIYAILIIVFSFLYSIIQINPEQMAENFQKSGRFIPGIKIGKDTAEHINRVLFRINCIGAPMLAFLAIIPNILTITIGLPQNATIGGTGIIIIITGAIQLWDSIRSAATSTSYRQQTHLIEKSISLQAGDSQVKKVHEIDEQLW